MSLMRPFVLPFYGGSGSSSLVPDVWPSALGGRPYQLDLLSNQMRHDSIPLLRQQADDSSSPSEASLNPDDLWRRAQDSWHHGAGQTFRDREDGNPNRFRSSKGIDAWTKYEISLLPGVDQKDASTDTNLALMPAGSRLYKVEGSTLTYTTDVTVDTPTWTATTGYTGGSILSIASDGFNVWITDGTNVWSTNTGTDALTSYNTLDADLLAYAKGRLMAAHENSIYNITSGTAPSALFSHGNTDFEWVGFADGTNAIYAAGFSGDKSLIYKITVRPDGATLDQPVLATPGLPDGEIIRSIYGYLGFIFIGTDKGWRFAIPDGQGNLTLGSLIETPDAVRCFEGQASYVWFGWTNYDSVSTGLGRADLTVLTDPAAQTLAYASDLMTGVTGATVQGDVLSVCTFQNIRVFAVSASGIWAQATTKVPSGTLETGLIGFGLPDSKTALFFDIRTVALVGSYAAALSSDGGAYTQVGTKSDIGTTGAQFPLNETVGERFEVRLTLTRSASVITTGPTLVRWTMKVNPAAELREFITVPFLLHETVQVQGEDKHVDVKFELNFIKNLRESRRLVALQLGSDAYSVSVEDYVFMAHHLTKNGRAFEGTCVTKCKRI